MVGDLLKKGRENANMAIAFFCLFLQARSTHRPLRFHEPRGTVGESEILSVVGKELRLLKRSGQRLLCWTRWDESELAEGAG